MKFTKMHGIGNDYVYVNCFEETVKDPAAVAKFVSDRHFGHWFRWADPDPPVGDCRLRDGYVQSGQLSGCHVRKRYPLRCQICL